MHGVETQFCHSYSFVKIGQAIQQMSIILSREVFLEINALKKNRHNP